MKVEGTPFEVMLTATGYHVMQRTYRPAVPGGAPVMLSVAGPYATRAEGVEEAERRTTELRERMEAGA